MSDQFNNEEFAVAFAPMTPPRDLWPEIAAQVQPRRRRFRLVPVGVAAALALTTTMTMMTAPQVATFAPTELQQMAQIMQVQQQAGLGAVSSAVQGAGVDRAMDGLLAAEREIREAIDAGSDNPALLKLLASVHRRQLDIVNQSMKV